MATGRDTLPVACTLTPGVGAGQITAWRKFNDDYLRKVERAPGLITVNYSRVDDAAARLTELVRIEQSCCSFAAWTVEITQSELRLVVAGDDDALDSLTFIG